MEVCNDRHPIWFKTAMVATEYLAVLLIKKRHRGIGWLQSSILLSSTVLEWRFDDLDVYISTTGCLEFSKRFIIHTVLRVLHLSDLSSYVCCSYAFSCSRPSVNTESWRSYISFRIDLRARVLGFLVSHHFLNLGDGVVTIWDSLIQVEFLPPPPSRDRACRSHTHTEQRKVLIPLSLHKLAWWLKLA